MIEKSKYAGMTATIRTNVGKSLGVAGKDFVIEDWAENIWGRSWTQMDGNPTAIIYGVRIGLEGDLNDVPMLSDDVLYGKIDGLGYLFHINELSLPDLEE